MSKIEVIKFGKYRLLKQIARGGMAEIFLACIGSIKSAPKFVVIKRVIYTQSKNKEFNKMFQNEGRIVTNLNHSNIASIHEFGVENEQFFICMEYISGRNLRQLVKKLRSQKRQLSVEECTYIVKNACLGLDYAHSCTDSVTGQPLNIIHRDISPQNIMISFNGDIKVIDFGIAKIDDSEATKVGVLKGKFEYMSPEQVRGKVLDRQTDVFSMGSILWELLAGKKLFTGSDPIQILKKIKTCHIPNLKTLRPDLPDRIVEITHCALQSNKNLRYNTMDELGNDLSIFLNKQYPHWTQNHFSSFIKKTYVEEILEERNNLKLCVQKLEADGSHKKWSFLSRSNSAEDMQVESNTFMSNPEDIDSARVVTNTMTHHETEQTSGGTADFADSITKTEFDDSLEKQSPVKKSKILNTNEYFQGNFVQDYSNKEIIQTCSKKEAFRHYNPYNTSLLVDAKASTLMDAKDRRPVKNQKSAVKYITYALFTAMFLIGGFYVFKSGFIKEFPQLSSGGKLGSKDIASNGPPQEIVSPPQTVSKAQIQRDPRSIPKKQVTMKRVFLDTNPSGAQFFVDNNGQKISGVTPIVQQFPANRKFTLTLKKLGFLDKQVVVTPEQVKKGQLVFYLDKIAKRQPSNESIIIND